MEKQYLLSVDQSTQGTKALLFDREGNLMKNKVVVTIAERDYTMVAVEDENYVRKCAQHVDQQLREIANSRISQADAAVLDAPGALAEGYRDLRDRFVFTIDPADAKDFDDALSLDYLEGDKLLWTQKQLYT